VVPPLQQPLGHDVPSQMHVPPLHRLPDGHAAPVPQVHTPLVQAFVVVGSHAAHVLPA
jgi:hypothetical protein